MKKSNRFYITHILDVITKIESFIKDIDKQEFFDNFLMQSAVIRQLEIICEVSNKLRNDL